MNSLARGWRNSGGLRGLCPCDPRIYRLRAKIGAKPKTRWASQGSPMQKVGEGVSSPRTYLGHRSGAQVASQQSPILRPFLLPVYTSSPPFAAAFFTGGLVHPAPADSRPPRRCPTDRPG